MYVLSFTNKSKFSWLTFQPIFDLTLTELPNQSTNPITFSRNLNLLLSKYSHFEHVYKDESNHKTRLGILSSIKTLIILFRLLSYFSIISAELDVIKLSVIMYIQNLSLKNNIIGLLFESLSALYTIQNS